MPNFSKRTIYAFAVLLLIVFLGISAALVRPSLKSSESLRQYATSVIEKCREAKFRPDCYDNEIPKLTDVISMEEAFEVVKLVQQKDERYLYCHVVSHKLSDKEVEKNPSRWKDVVARCPTTFCNNGCHHGALIQRFNSETLTDAQIEEVKPDLQDVCEPRGRWSPVEIERSMCYHALGHLHLYITSADIKKAVALCELIGRKPDGRNYIQTCTEGVFMQIYQPLEPEDFALVQNLTPKKEEVPVFCEKYHNTSNMSWDACRREAWPLFREEILKPAGLVKFCSYTDNHVWQKVCYAALMNIITIHHVIQRENDISGIQKFCSELPDVPRLPATPKELCFAHAARQLVQVDPRYQTLAAQVCVFAETVGIGEPCFSELIQMGNKSFRPRSRELENFCNNLPQPWKTHCLKK